MNFILNIFQEFALSIFFGSILALILANFLATTYRVVIMAVAVLALCTSVYLKGGLDQKLILDKEIAELKVKVAALDKERIKITAKAAASHDTNRRLILENGKLKDLNAYLTDKEVNMCVIPNGFIRLHNESATGKLSNIPIASGKSNDASGKIDVTP